MGYNDLPAARTAKFDPFRVLGVKDFMDKGIFISEIRPGMKVSGTFCVASKSLRTTRTGSSYLAMTLLDSSGQMEARVWDRADELDSGFSQGDYVAVEAEAQEYNGQCQLKISGLKQVADQDVDPKDFIPVAQIDRTRAWRLVQQVMEGLSDRDLKALLEALFAQEEIRQGFMNAPAARKMHHAAIGGLLEHSLSVLMLCEKICTLYPHLNRDLLAAASICHDIGKMKEFTWKRMPIDYSRQGRLLGHISMGMEMISKAADKAGLDQESESLLHLKHLVLSHHGRLEFGSPVLPMTEEAVVFHMMDDLDAKINYLGGLKEQMEGELQGAESAWSPYQRLFERFFLLGGQQCVNPARQIEKYMDEYGLAEGSGPASEKEAGGGSRNQASSKGSGEDDGQAAELEDGGISGVRQNRLF